LRHLLTKDAPFIWETEHAAALEKLKNALLTDAVLIYRNLDEPYYVQIDASKEAVDCCLLQMHDGILKPIYFASRSSKKHERCLSSTDAELAGLVYALSVFRIFLSNGKKLIVLSDHCSIKYVQQLKFSSSPKLIRQSLLQNFNFEIRHISGAKNILADFLSRYPMDKEVDQDNEDSQ
jgi:hypothetical protein